MRPARPGYRFPWREGNRFRLLADGEAFYAEMLAAIAEARRYLLLEFYLVEPGRVATQFFDACRAAAERGVEVYLLLDHFGSRALGHAQPAELAAAGVRLSYHNPLNYGELRRNLFRDHRKLLLADGRVAFTGGAGLTDEFIGEQGWRETMIRIEGPCVGDWQALFAANWKVWSGAPLLLPPVPGTGGAGPGEEGERQSGRVTQTRGGLHSEVVRSLIRRVNGAERRVWLASGYFLPSWKLRRALRRAVRRGVDVRLLLPGPRTDHPAVRHAGRRYYSRLLRHGVQIFEYLPRFMHQKVLLCDHWCAIGSANVDRWTLRWNLEANQEVEDSAFAREVAAMLEEDFRVSRAITRERWRRRSRLNRLLEWFWGRVEQWLTRSR